MNTRPSERIFITGGEGFIGYHLTRKLIAAGHTVMTYDIQTHSIPFGKSRWPEYIIFRTNHLQSDRLTRVRGDVNDRGRLAHALQQFCPDRIVHMASLAIAGVSNDYPEEAQRNILNTTVTLMDVVKELNQPIKQVVYTSSSMVYGNFERDENDQIIPAREDQLCNPIDIYGAMKLGGELLIKAYNYRFGIPYTIIRPSAVYGPTDANRRVTEIFVNNALTGKPLKLDNGGLHQLDFTYVEDLANGFYLALSSDRAINQIFNLTCGQGRTIKELAEAICKELPEAMVQTHQASVYRPNRGQLDISKAREILGYQPADSLESGIRKYIQFIRDEGFFK